MRKRSPCGAASQPRPVAHVVKDLTAECDGDLAATGASSCSRRSVDCPALQIGDFTRHHGYTPGMKTVISIPDQVFNEAERLVARFKTSRSELYSRAIAEFISRHDEDVVTRALDEVTRNVNADPSDTQTSTAAALAILRQVEW